MSKVLKTIWSEFIYGGHLLSIGSAGIVFSAAKLIGSSYDWAILIVVYCFSQAIYLFNRLEEFETDIETNPSRTEHIKNRLKSLKIEILAYLVFAYVIMIYQRTWGAIFFSFIPLFIGWTYTKYLKDLTSKIIGLKTIIVSITWALLLPFYYLYFEISSNLMTFLLVFLFILLRWVLNTSFFDVKDIAGDQKIGLKTYPVYFGIKRYMLYAKILNFVSVVPIVIGVINSIFPKWALVFVILIPFIHVCLNNSQKYPKKMSYYYVYADSEFIVWALLVVIGLNLTRI
ncbi:MAG: UbiA family prenyltransferase [Patescibacteria group bacterium]|jgi:4-hydroxybenzoate polyprenyltransferase